MAVETLIVRFPPGLCKVVANLTSAPGRAGSVHWLARDTTGS